MIDFCTLGTGGAIPLPHRALASLYLRIQGHGLLIDCGEGTQTQIRRIGWGFRSIDAVLLTHYHADHCGGLPGFLLSMAKSGRDTPLHIYGPTGLHRVIEALRVIAPQLPYEITLHEFPMAGGTGEACGLFFTAFPLDHGIPCLGYSFSLPRPRRFDPVRAEALSIPRKYWGMLQGGTTVEGFTPEDVLEPERPGLSLVYATDTRPVEAIAQYGFRCDLMILEGMYDEESKLDKALANHHMLYREAAALAKDAEARQLLLTHFSNATEDPLLNLHLAKEVFPDSRAAEDLLAGTIRWGGEIDWWEKTE